MARISPAPLRHKENDAGEVPLYLRLHAGDKTRYMSLGVKIHKRHWNDNQRCVRKSHKQHRRINSLIQQRLSEAQAAILDLQREGLTVTPKRIKARLASEERDSTDFIRFGWKVIERLERNGQAATAKSYRSALRKLEDYTGGRLPFEDLTVSLLEDYRAYLAGEHGNSGHTIANDLSAIRSFFNKGVKEGYAQAGDNPFLSFRIERPKTKRERLSLEEIRDLQRLDVEGEPRLQVAKDIFLFCLYAQGMRIRDALLMRRSNVKNGRVDYRMSKTGEHKSVKLVPVAQEIAERYLTQTDGEDALLFPPMRGRDLDTPEERRRAVASVTSLVNQRLRVLAERAGLDVRLSSHLARHSFAGLALEKDWRVPEIKKALGHQNLSTTERYLKGFSDRDLDDKMNELFGGGEGDE